jgi:hypothetical protein
MNKKWVIGLGLGVVGLAAVGLGGLVALGYWADRSTEGAGMEVMMDAQARARRVVELGERHPFQPPAQGQALRLEAPRLEAYLNAREATQPAYEVLTRESAEFVRTQGAQLDRRDTRAFLKAASDSQRMVGKAQGALLQNLEAQGMSLQEFQAITAVLYPPPTPSRAPDAGGPGEFSKAASENMAQLEAQLASLTPQLEDPTLTEAQRLQLEQRRAGLRKYISTLEKASGKDVTDANAALARRYAERIAKVADPVFDQLLVTPSTRTR